MTDPNDVCLLAIINTAQNSLAPMDDLHTYHISFPPGYNSLLISENARYDNSYLYFPLESDTAFIIPNCFSSRIGN